MCEPASHTANCEFVLNLLPLFREVEPSFMQLIGDTFSQQQLFDQTLGSTSFEEYSKEQIANVPIEGINTDIFAGECSISSNKWQDRLANENEGLSHTDGSYCTALKSNHSRLENELKKFNIMFSLLWCLVFVITFRFDGHCCFVCVCFLVSFDGR